LISVFDGRVIEDVIEVTLGQQPSVATKRGIISDKSHCR